MKNYYSFGKAALSALALGATVVAASAAAEGWLLFEETFPNGSRGRENLNLNAIGWEAFGGDAAQPLGAVSGGGMNSVLIAATRGHPADEDGFLALILANTPPAHPAYAVVKTGLTLKAPKLFTWRLNGAPQATVRVRLLVQAGGRWYASDVSDTRKEYFESAHEGTSADFARAGEAEVTKRLEFSRDALDWREFTLEPGRAMKLGDTAPADLPDAPLTGVGFYVVGGNTGRIDTLRVFDGVPLSQP